MDVEYMREDKYQDYKNQASLFTEDVEPKAILVYKSQNYLQLLKSCVSRELPTISEEEYHEFWERCTGGRRIVSFEFVKVKKKVHSEILSFLETKKNQILAEKKQELLKSLEGREQELEEFRKQNPILPPIFWIQMQISGILKEEFLKERSVK